MRRILLLAGGFLTIAGALLPWVDLHVKVIDLSVHLDAEKHGIGILALLAGFLAVFAALVHDGAAISILSSVAAAGAAGVGTYRILHSPGYEIASATGLVDWEAGLGLWAMGLGAAAALAALLTASDERAHVEEPSYY
jgi:hypothetical protein